MLTVSYHESAGVMSAVQAPFLLRVLTNFDCSEGDNVDIFQLLDRVLASEGFVPGTP
jgi:hypothetical protein